MSKSFRPEFLNRIDRVIVFRPFDRSQMKELLQKELREVLARRGLRARPWAVELDDAAADFIIEQGFSPELGARPLKRAVERHLLAPIAEAIVEHTAPQGDLFLFVSRAPGAGITVSFVNLESGEDAAAADGHTESTPDARSARPRRARARGARRSAGAAGAPRRAR